MKQSRRIAESPEEPPLKKRRYVPGGPGGGGRFIDFDGAEVEEMTPPKKTNGTP